MPPRVYSSLLRELGPIKETARALGVTRATLYARERGGEVNREAVLALQKLLDTRNPLVFSPGKEKPTPGLCLLAFYSRSRDLYVSGIAELVPTPKGLQVKLPDRDELSPLPTEFVAIPLQHTANFFANALLEETPPVQK